MFEIVAEGNVYLVKESGKAAGSRTAVLPDGKLACTFTMNTKSGANHFTFAPAARRIKFGQQ